MIKKYHNHTLQPIICGFTYVNNVMYSVYSYDAHRLIKLLTVCKTFTVMYNILFTYLSYTMTHETKTLFIRTFPHDKFCSDYVSMYLDEYLIKRQK